MSANYQSRAEAESSMLLAKLAGDMEHVAIRIPVLLGHDRPQRITLKKLRGAAACVKMVGEETATIDEFIAARSR